MLIPPEKVKEELGSEDEALNQIENADKQINALEVMIRKHIEESREKENKDHDMPLGDISQPTTAAPHRKVITVQPIVSYDEIFLTSNQPTEGELVENLIAVKKEPGTVKNDVDLIFVDHEYPNIDTQIKSEPTELARHSKVSSYISLQLCMAAPEFHSDTVNIRFLLRKHALPEPVFKNCHHVLGGFKLWVFPIFLEFCQDSCCH